VRPISRGLAAPALSPLHVPRVGALSAGLQLHSSRPILLGMAKKAEATKPTVWSIYKLAAKAVRLGKVEAPDEATAIENGARRNSRFPPTG
jgi:hypothetical protein